MNDKPRLSILIPWRDREELRLTLAANAPVFRGHDAEALILNCGGASERLRELIAASEAANVRQVDIPVLGFNRSLALNIGLAQARADTVFTLDADAVLLDPLPVEALDGRSFVTIESVYESGPLGAGQTRDEPAAPSANGAFLEFAFRGGVKVRHQLSLRNALGNMRTPTGLLLARKNDLLSIAGYNSELETWGWEDDDVLVRLQYVLGRRRVLSGAALHLTHGDNQRSLRGSRSHSDQRNFIRCCRNYNRGLFLGSYHADMAKIGDYVSEAPGGVDAPALPRAPIHYRGPHTAPSMNGPADCGREIGTMCERGTDWMQGTPSLSQLLVEAAMTQAPIGACAILVVGASGARLAAQLAPRGRHVTGVVQSEPERSIAAGLGLPNYHAVVGNPYAETFRECLPLRTFDVIVDCGFISHACCQRHLRALMENYASLLAPTGWLATAEPGVDGAAADDCWSLSEMDLVCLAGQFGFYVIKAWPGIYKLTRCQTTL